MVSNPSRTSSLVSATPVRPFTLTAYLATMASNQPQRRGRPVVEPNSRPTWRSFSPSASSSSVGNGPLPTLVTYALEMPITSCSSLGLTPAPVQAPPAQVDDEVT